MKIGLTIKQSHNNTPTAFWKLSTNSASIVSYFHRLKVSNQMQNDNNLALIIVNYIKVI